MLKWPWRKKWYCSNVGNGCSKADAREEIPVLGDAIEPICEECACILVSAQKTFPLVPTCGIVVLILAAACYLLWPSPPWGIKLSTGLPGNIKLYSGDSATWNVEVTGGKASASPILLAQSLSLSSIPANGIMVNTTDATNRKFRLTIRSLAGQTGRVEIKLFASVGGVVKATTNVFFEVEKYGPPILAAHSPLPSIWEAERNSIVFQFQVSDAKADSARLSLLAIVEPSEAITVNIQSTGAVRIVTLSRKQWESGPIKLAVRLLTPDGRETNHTYSVSVVPLPVPALIIAVNSTTPPGGAVHPGEKMTWEFTVGGGILSEKPAVSAESLSPSVLPQAAVQIETADDTRRKYKLTARPIAGQNGMAEVKVSVRIAAELEAATNLAFQVVALGPPTLALQSPQPLVLESARDSLLLLFTLSDEKTEAAKLTFSATVEPAEKAVCNVEGSGGTRTVTLSRNQRESGPVKLSVRVATPDGRETNQIYTVTVVAPVIQSPVLPPIAVVRGLLKKARAAWIERRYQEAIGFCDDAIALDPGSVEAWTIKGGVYYSWLRYADAIAACDAAIALNAKFADAWFTKASSEQASGNLPGALGSWRKFLETVQAPDARVPVVEDRVRKLEGR